MALRTPKKVRYDDVTHTLDMSDHRLRSHRDPCLDTKAAVRVDNLVSAIHQHHIDPMRIESLNVSRCRLVDEDLIELSDVVIQQLGGVSYVDISENWFLYTYREIDRTNPVFKAVQRMARWGIKVKITGTQLHCDGFLRLFELAELAYLYV
jgi:hypothetical protein